MLESNEGDMKDKRCHKCRKFEPFQTQCHDKKVSVKANHICTVDHY